MAALIQSNAAENAAVAIIARQIIQISIVKGMRTGGCAHPFFECFFFFLVLCASINRLGLDAFKGNNRWHYLLALFCDESINPG